MASFTITNPERSAFKSPIIPFAVTAAKNISPDESPSPAAAARSRSNPRELANRLCAFMLIGDWIAALFAILAGLQLRAWQSAGPAFGVAQLFRVERPLGLWALAGGVLFAWLMVMFKTYETTNLYRMQKWTSSILKASALWSVVNLAFIGLFKTTAFAPRIGILYCLVTLTGCVGLWRLFSIVFLLSPSIKEAVSSRIIVIGWNEKASLLRQAMRRDLAQLGEVVGCVAAPGAAFSIKLPAGLAVLGDYSSLPALVAESEASTIILADVSLPAEEIQKLIAFCQREMLVFKIVPDYFPALNSGLQVQTVSGIPLLGVCQLPLYRMINRLMKRGVDIVGAIIGILLTSPIVLVFSAMVYSESRGPVIFRQRRTSRGGHTFLIYKIRSMRLDAEIGSGAVWCQQEDPRRLRIGTFMRRWNIDELPQFWNVLYGDMSLVGPRPERPELIERFKHEIPNYNARHEIRSGLTGWAQVQGLRGNTDLRCRIEADLYYLENWSLFFDFYCIGATFFKPKNAM